MLPEKVFEKDSFDIASFLAEAEAYHKEVVAEMVKDPVQWCSNLAYRIDVATRELKYFVYRCKDKNCESCNRQYKLDKFQIVTDTMVHFRTDYMVEVVGTEDDCKTLRDEYGKERIIRVPKEDGSVIMLCAITPREGDVVLTRNEMDASYIEDLFETPKKTRVTGGHVRSEEEKDKDEEYVTVYQSIFVLDIKSPIELFDIHNEIISRSYHLNPTAETLQQCINEHDRIFEEVALEMGYLVEVVAVAKEVKVPVKDINWQKKRFHIPDLF